jgi:hypothetical protein
MKNLFKCSFAFIFKSYKMRKVKVFFLENRIFVEKDIGDVVERRCCLCFDILYLFSFLKSFKNCSRYFTSCSSLCLLVAPFPFLWPGSLR